MHYFWDTNILLDFIRDSVHYRELNHKYNFFDNGNILSLSAVSFGENLSLSTQLKWGERKVNKMELFLNEDYFLSIFNRETLDAYAQIDAYSQNKHPTLKLPNGMTARNMGKNDLWIAATAHAISADLVTTDKDFDHLDGVFLNVINA